MNRLSRVAAAPKKKQVIKRILQVAGLAMVHGGILFLYNVDTPGNGMESQLMETSGWYHADIWTHFSSVSIPTLVATAVVAVFMVLVSQNIVASGKQGWGWFTVCVLGAMLLMIGKVALSMFLEVSSDDAIPRDWDED